MATLHGSTVLWDAEAGVAQNGASAIGYIGPGPQVALWISTTVSGTFDVEVGILPSNTTASGLNAVDFTQADGGLSWHKYDGATALSVAASVPRCFDFAPFSPEYVRVVRTDGGAAATITAIVTCEGPN